MVRPAVGRDRRALLLVLVGYFVLLADAIWIILPRRQGWLNLSTTGPMPA